MINKMNLLIIFSYIISFIFLGIGVYMFMYPKEPVWFLGSIISAMGGFTFLIGAIILTTE